MMEHHDQLIAQIHESATLAKEAKETIDAFIPHIMNIQNLTQHLKATACQTHQVNPEDQPSVNAQPKKAARWGNVRINHDLNRPPIHMPYLFKTLTDRVIRTGKHRRTRHRIHRPSSQLTPHRHWRLMESPTLDLLLFMDYPTSITSLQDKYLLYPAPSLTKQYHLGLHSIPNPPYQCIATHHHTLQYRTQLTSHRQSLPEPMTRTTI
jgi:hypothetical protein